MKLLPISVFLGSGLAFFLVILQSLLWAVWGAPTSWNQYMALAGSLALCAAGLVCFGNVAKAYWIARGALSAIGFFFVPAVVSLVPAHNTITSPLAFVVILGYLAAVGFAFLTPRIASWPAIAYALVICTAVVLYTTAYLDRAKTGEYAWPVFDFYLAEGNEPLSVGKDHMQVLTDSDIDRLKTIGLRGEVNWYGRSGNAGAASVIVICRARPDEPKRIHFPKAERVLLIYDGDRWMTVPASFESYERFVTLQTDGMLSQELSSGGVQSSRVYMTW